MALGEIGLKFDEFYALTPRSFTNAVNGYYNKQYNQSKVSWEQIRYLFYASLKPHLKGNPSLKSLMPLPWDDEISDEIEFETEEQVQEAFENMNAYWEEIDRKRQLKKSKVNNEQNGISTD